MSLFKCLISRVIGNLKSTGTATALVAYSEKGLTASVSTRSLISNFSAHSGVAGTSIGGTLSSGVPTRPSRASTAHRFIPSMYF